jgi:hypothetical protein
MATTASANVTRGTQTAVQFNGYFAASQPTTIFRFDHRVFIASGIAGNRVFNQTGTLSSSIIAGLWNGMISGLITFVALMFIRFAFPHAALLDPENVRALTARGVTDIYAVSVGDSLVGAINHLWIGSLIGVMCGGIGAAFGKQPT